MACPDQGTPAALLAQTVAEAAVLCLVNEQRTANGIAALTPNASLQAAAHEHAREAVRLKWWAGGGPKVHINPETGSTPASRIKAAGYCSAAASPLTNENAYDS